MPERLQISRESLKSLNANFNFNLKLLKRLRRPKKYHSSSMQESWKPEAWATAFTSGALKEENSRTQFKRVSAFLALF